MPTHAMKTHLRRLAMRMRAVNCGLALAVLATWSCEASSELEPVASESAASGKFAPSQRMTVQRSGASSSSIDSSLFNTSTFSFGYNGSQVEAVAIANTPDGGYVTGGTAWVNGRGYDAWLMKFDAEGNRIWESVYGTPANESLTALMVALNGDIVFTGSARQGSLDGSHDIWLVRISPSGDIVWQKAYGGINQVINKGGHEMARAVIETNDGNIAVVGETASFSLSGALFDIASAAFFLEVAGSSGAIVQSEALSWSGYYNDPGRRNTRALNIVQTADGGFAIAGTTAYSWDQSFWALKMNRNGAPAWMNYYHHTVYDNIHSLVQDIDGQIVLAGSACDYTANDCDVWTVKVSEGTGAIEWARKFDGAAYPEEYKIRKVGSSFVLSGAYSLIGNSGNSNMWFIMLDGAGNLGASHPGTWQKTYGGQRVRDVAIRPSGGFLLVGQTTHSQGWGTVPFFVGTDPEGAVTCPAPISTDVNSTDGVLVRSVIPVPPTGETCCTDEACGYPLNPPYDLCESHETCVRRVCIPKPVDWVRDHLLTARDTLAVSNVKTGSKQTCQ